MGNNILGGNSFTGWATSTTSKDIVGVVTIENTSEATFCVPGLYDWTVPNGVTSINAVLIGGGANGNGTSLGGAGGELCYFNGLTVTPGSTLKIKVGNGGDGTNAWGEPSIIFDKSIAVTNANYNVITPGFTNTSPWTPNITTSFSYSAIVVGGGAGGSGSGTTTSTGHATGGGGGGSAYINNFYPFDKTGSFTLTVGTGGTGGAGGATPTVGSAGGTSSIVASDGTEIISATGGGTGSYSAGSVGGAGGTGSANANYGTSRGTYTGGAGGDASTGFGGSGGGGAAGPGGNGGKGGNGNATTSSGSPGTAALANTGAGAGGGGGSNSTWFGGGGGGAGSALQFTGTSTSTGGTGGTYGTTSAVAGGGGVGSVGSNGSAGGGVLTNGANGGAGYANGAGGGGSSNGGTGGAGGTGGLFIIWPGATRSYPSTNTVNASYTTLTYWITVNSSVPLNMSSGMPIYFDQAIGPLSANTVYTIVTTPANFSNASNFYYFQIADSRGRTSTLPAATNVSTTNVNIYFPSNIARGGGSTLPSIKGGVSGTFASNLGGTTTSAGGGGAGGYTSAGGNGGLASTGGGGGGGSSNANVNGGGGVGIYGLNGINGQSTSTGGSAGSFGYNAVGNNGGLFGGGGGYTGTGGSGAVRITWNGNTFPNSAIPTTNTIISNGILSSSPSITPSNTQVTATSGPTGSTYATVTLNNNPTNTGKSSFTVAGLIASPPVELNSSTNSPSITTTNRDGTAASAQPTNNMQNRIDNTNDLSQETNLISNPMPDNVNNLRKSEKNLSTSDAVVNRTGWTR